MLGLGVRGGWPESVQIGCRSTPSPPASCGSGTPAWSRATARGAAAGRPGTWGPTVRPPQQRRRAADPCRPASALCPWRARGARGAESQDTGRASVEGARRRSSAPTPACSSAGCTSLPRMEITCVVRVAWAVRRYMHHGTAEALPFMHDERAHGRTRLPGTHALVAVCLDGQLRHGIVRGAARAAQQGAERRASERQGGRCQPRGERPYSGTKRRTHTLHNGIPRAPRARALWKAQRPPPTISYDRGGRTALCPMRLWRRTTRRCTSLTHPRRRSPCLASAPSAPSLHCALFAAAWAARSGSCRSRRATRMAGLRCTTASAASAVVRLCSWPPTVRCARVAATPIRGRTTQREVVHTRSVYAFRSRLNAMLSSPLCPHARGLGFGG